MFCVNVWTLIIWFIAIGAICYIVGFVHGALDMYKKSTNIMNELMVEKEKRQ